MNKFPMMLAAMLMCACAPAKKDVNVNLAGYPPAFRAGYVDGCESSKKSSGHARDEGRFKHEAQYAAGWRDGFDICTRKKK